MILNLLTPHKKLVDSKKIEELYVPGAAGTLDIFDRHANLLTSLETGKVKWKSNGVWESASVSTGFLEIFDEQVTIVADVSELASDIDVQRAKKALENAQKKLQDGGLDDASFRKFELKLKRAMARVSATGSE
jgi:F-type H+-transporting ATPase subunit epsilon